MTTNNQNYYYDGPKGVTSTPPLIVPPSKTGGKHAQNLIFLLK